MGACTHENCPSWVVKRVVGPLPLLVTKHPSRVSKLVTVLRTVYYKPIHNILPYPLRSYYRYPTMLVWMLPRRVLIKEGSWCWWRYLSMGGTNGQNSGFQSYWYRRQRQSRCCTRFGLCRINCTG